MYQGIFRPALFRLPPETAHQLTLHTIGLAGKIPLIRKRLARQYSPHFSHPVQVFGLTFPNAVGLAAGYDKDAQSIAGLSALGFGHIEVGTITPRPQVGNPKPRVFRLVEDQGVINRMGFPGKGAAACLRNLKKARRGAAVLGVNIGKNKDTPLEQAADDYTYSIRLLAPFAGYFAVNISSPNTVGLRDLQHARYLRGLLDAVRSARDEQTTLLDKPLPLLVKLAPDMFVDELNEALDVILDSGIEGIIATNTTISRPPLISSNQTQTGGLSGQPLRGLATRTIAHINDYTKGTLPIIGVGGVSSPQDALEKLNAGATLVQVYTGLIYHGPSLVREIMEGIAVNPSQPVV